MGACLSRACSLEQGLITMFLWRYRPVMRNTEMKLWHPSNTAVTYTGNPSSTEISDLRCGHLKLIKDNCICTPRRAFFECKSTGREVETKFQMHAQWPLAHNDLQSFRAATFSSLCLGGRGGCQVEHAYSPTLPQCHQLLCMFKIVRMENRIGMSVRCT